MLVDDEVVEVSVSELPDAASIFKPQLCSEERHAESALQSESPEKSQIDTFVKNGSYSQGAAIIEEYQKMKPLFIIERETRVPLKRRTVKRRNKQEHLVSDFC